MRVSGGSGGDGGDGHRAMRGMCVVVPRVLSMVLARLALGGICFRLHTCSAAVQDDPKSKYLTIKKIEHACATAARTNTSTPTRRTTASRRRPTTPPTTYDTVADQNYCSRRVCADARDPRTAVGGRAARRAGVPAQESCVDLLVYTVGGEPVLSNEGFLGTGVGPGSLGRA